MNNYFRQREDCLKVLEEVSDDHEYIEDLRQNLEFIQSCIEDCQNVICGIDIENIDWESMYSGFSTEQIGYFLSKLTQSSLNYAILSWQREEIVNQKENYIKELQLENHRLTIHKDVLNTLISNKDQEVPGRNSERRRAMCPEELLYSIEKHNSVCVKNENSSDDSVEEDKPNPLDQTMISNNTRELKNGNYSDGHNLQNAPVKQSIMNTSGGTEVKSLIK